MTTYEEETTSDRLPPFDEQAEMSVVGGMMISRDAITQVSGIIRPGDFYRPANQLIYDAIVRLSDAGEPVDVISVDNELLRAGEAGRYGGSLYLYKCTDAIPTAANAGYYAKIVSDKAVLRRLIEVGTRTAQVGYSGDGDLAELIAHCQQMIMDVEALSTAGGVDLVHSSEVYREVVDDQDATDEQGAVTPPYADLREVIRSTKPGQVVIVGARPGVGKSVVAADFARHNAMHHQVGTVMFSLEMTNLELGQRIMAAESGVLLQKIRDRELDEADWDRVAKVKQVWDLAPFWMSDDFNISLPHMRSRLRRHTRTHKIDLVIVDYLQLFDGPTSESRQQEVSKISRGLKKLAKEFGIVIVVLSQLNRESTKRTDKKPQLSDLRESGSIEQDADIVLLLDREDTRDKESVRAGEIDIDVAKNRGGTSGRVVELAFQGHYSRIVDMAGTNWGGA
ncbi:replicative DNA helicase [Nocardiopsis sp. CA-288880]|uniref:replicative DNA helicase n=1 Tax=Nocardiopsis sp. CA-288880 TaxID=3239995 RepID=UPI003D97EFC7